MMNDLQPKPGVTTSEFAALVALFAAIPLDPGNARWYVAGFAAYCVVVAAKKFQPGGAA